MIATFHVIAKKANAKQIEVLTCLFVLLVCVNTQNEQEALVANDDDVLESGKGGGCPRQA